MTGKRVFVSHTSELSREPGDYSFVQATLEGVRKAGFVGVEMSDFVATPRPAADVCSANVKQCAILVGVLGFRYGSFVRSHGDVSYTELEYRSAIASGIPRLMFLLNERDDLPSGLRSDGEDLERQRQFRDAVLADDSQTCKFFDTSHQLQAEVEKALAAISLDHRHDFAPLVKSRPSGTVKHQLLAAQLSVYAPDRRDQEDQVETAIGKLRHVDDQKYHGPIAIFIHGETKQCSERFVSRLVESVLPRAFRISKDRHAVKELHLELPGVRQNREGEYFSSLLNRIAKKLVQHSAGLDQQWLIDHLRSNKDGPLLVNTHLYDPDLNAKGLQRALLFLKFWDELDYRPMPFAPVVCVRLNYCIKKRGLPWFGKRGRARIQSFLDRLSEDRRMPIVVLDELSDLNETHVQSWLIDHFDIKQQEELKPKVREIFSRVSTIAMADFAEELTNWAKQ